MAFYILHYIYSYDMVIDKHSHIQPLRTQSHNVRYLVHVHVELSVKSIPDTMEGGILEMTKFKHIKGKKTYSYIHKIIVLTEIAYQLKRIADNTDGLKK